MPRIAIKLFKCLKNKIDKKIAHRCSGCGRKFKSMDMVFDGHTWTCFECYTGMKAEWRVTWRGVFLPVLEKDQKGA